MIVKCFQHSASEDIEVEDDATDDEIDEAVNEWSLDNRSYSWKKEDSE